jgi:hypothetical protein
LTTGASSWTSIAAAAILPVLVVGLGLYGMEQLRTFADARENRNAGKVINGRVVQGGVVGMIDRTLEQHHPDVIILGNSLSNTDIRPVLLARRLGIKRQKVQRFSIPNSIGAHWYLILKNRVYANGHRPRLVIVLSDMQSALATTPRSEASYLNLSVHMGENEPLVDSKLGARVYALDRVRQNRGKVREKALTEARNTVVDLLWHHRLFGPPAQTKRTEDALERVFDAENTDMRLHNNVIPIYEQTKKLQPFDPAALPMPEDSFLRDITRMVTDNGGHILYVRPPMSPLLPDALGDLVLEEAEPLATALVAEEGGTYLDARPLPLEATHFHNVDHMNDEGAEAFTEALARVIWAVPSLRDFRPRSGFELDLLRFVDHVDGQLVAHEPDVAYHKPPPPLPRAARPMQTCVMKREDVACFSTENFHFISDKSTAPLNPAARRCSPIQVLEDGEPLKVGNVSCEEVRKYGMGRFCHTSSRIAFSASDDTRALENGRAYTLALDPNRSCYGSQWLYPKDRLRLDVDTSEFGDAKRGAQFLTLRGADMSSLGEDARVTWLTVRVKVNDRVRFEDIVSVDQITAENGVQFRLDTPIRSTDRGVSIDVTNDSDNFVLLTTARLSAR